MKSIIPIEIVRCIFEGTREGSVKKTIARLEDFIAYEPSVKKSFFSGLRLSCYKLKAVRYLRRLQRMSPEDLYEQGNEDYLLEARMFAMESGWLLR